MAGMDYQHSYLTDMGRDIAPPSALDGALRKRVLEFHLRHLLPKISRGPALDVGCGRGEAMLAWKALGFAPVSGCEIGAEQIRAGRAAGMDIEEEDGLAFLRKSRDQALVTAFDVLEHLDAAVCDALLDAAFHALRAGGWLVVQFPNAASPFFGTVQYADPTHRTVLGAPVVAAKLRKIGFRDVRAFESGPVPHGVASRLRLAAWQGIRSVIKIFNVIETGSPGEGPHTRVCLVAAQRPSATSASTKA